MKKLASWVLGVMCMAGLVGKSAQACDNVFVETLNNSGEAVSVGVTMNSSTPVSLSLPLGIDGSRTDDLPVAAGSPNPLQLNAMVTAGSLQAKCSMAVTNDNVTGECSGVVDPKYELLITLSGGGTTTPPPVTGGTCKHDNGNHIGEYAKLGLKVGVDVPFHNGKPGGCESSEHGKSMGHGKGSCMKNSTAPAPSTTPAVLSCQFVPVNSF